ncbi:MAG: glycosyltransferase family 4 protein [Phycisphaerae bacterium]
MIEWLALGAWIGSFLLSLVMTGIVMRLAHARGFLDRPGGHKSHTTPVALGGGIGIFLSICLPLLGACLAAYLWNRSGPPDWLPATMARHLPGLGSKLGVLCGILGSAMVLFLVGLIDDRKPLGPAPKFFFQFAVAIFTVVAIEVRAAEALPSLLSIVVTVFWIVLITNAFNFLDNMDGLSAGVAALATLVLAVTSWRAGQLFVPVMALVVSGTLCGFLVYNFSPAKIFMGDAGSLVVGYLLSVLTILTTFYDPQQNTRPLGVVAPIVILAVPLYDVLSVVIHRLRAGQSPLRGDKRHFSHRLQRLGMTTPGAVLTIYLATAATALPAMALPRATWDVGVLLLLQCFCVVLMIAILEHTGQRHQ